MLARLTLSGMAWVAVLWEVLVVAVGAAVRGIATLSSQSSLSPGRRVGLGVKGVR